jgi:periplasmic copper chaperone A
MKRAARVLLTIAAMALSDAAFAQSTKIEVVDAWARPPIGQTRNTAAYLTLTNRGGAPDRLLSASTSAAGKAEMHTTVREGEVMRMREVQNVELKPGAAVKFAPGGLHVMLLDVKPLKAGDTFTLTLQFEKAGKQDVAVKVQPGPSGQPMPMQHQHQGGS